MPRRAKGPRLWLRPANGKQAAVWVIRDRQVFRSTSCAPDEREAAEACLAEYLSTEAPPLYGTTIGDGIVYFVGFNGFVKIGFSVNVERRIRDLQKGAPYRLEVYAAIPGSLNDEKQLHRRFIRHRTDIGEWFHYSDEIKAYINSFRVAVAAE